MMSSHNINLFEKMLAVVKNNAFPLAISSGALIAAVWLGDIEFNKQIAIVTGDVPGFVEKIGTNNSNATIIVVLYIVSNLLYYSSNRIVSSTFPEMELNVVKDIVKDTIESVKTSKTQINVNEYIMNIRKVAETKMLYSFIASYIIPTIIVAAGLLWQFRGSGKFLLWMIILYVVVMIITLWAESISVEKSKNNEKHLNGYFDHVQDVVNNVDTVVINNTKNFEVERINNTRSNVSGLCSENEVSDSGRLFKLDMLGFMATIITMAIAIGAYKSDAMQKEGLITVGLTSITMLHYYESVVGKFRTISEKLGKLNEASEYFSKFSIDDDKCNGVLDVSHGDISFRNVTLKYNDKIVVSNYNMDIKGDCITGIVGKIGSGKTTMFKALMGLVKYDGDIFVDGQNIKNASHESLTKTVTFITQHPKLFNSTIFYNLTYGTDANEKDVRSIISRLGLSAFFNGFPEKLATQVGKEGSQLSGGQRQMIALVRAMLQNKKIMLFDEPTSSLDPAIKTLFLNTLRMLRDKTIIIITHDKNVVGLFDTTIHFENGLVDGLQKETQESQESESYVGNYSAHDSTYGKK